MMCLYFNAETIAVSKDILVAFTAIISLIAVIAGYNAWRREHVGKTEYELARRLLRAAKRVQRAFAQARNPFYFRKGSTAANKDNDPVNTLVENHKSPGKSQRIAYNERIAILSEAMNELDDGIIDADVLGWPTEMKIAVRKLEECCFRLTQAFNENITTLENQTFDAERGKEYGPIIASTSDDADINPFTRDIDNAVATIERELQTYLKRKHDFSNT